MPRKSSDAETLTGSIDTQPTGIAGEGVLYALELSEVSKSETKGAKKKGGKGSRKSAVDTKTENEIGFRAIVRESLTVGHIVEIRKKRADAGMFGGISFADCCSCMKDDTASASAKGKGYTSTVFSATDIEYTELVESRVEMDAAAAVGGGCCAMCCPADEDAEKLTQRSKNLVIHLRNKPAPIVVDWEDIMGQKKDIPETCCMPGNRTKYANSEDTDADGTLINVTAGEEWETMPKCMEQCSCCFGSMDLSKTEKVITQKYYMDPSVKDRLEFDTQDEVMSSLTHVLLAAMTANRYGGSEKHTVIAQPMTKGKGGGAARPTRRAKGGAKADGLDGFGDE